MDRGTYPNFALARCVESEGDAADLCRARIPH